VIRVEDVACGKNTAKFQSLGSLSKYGLGSVWATCWEKRRVKQVQFRTGNVGEALHCHVRVESWVAVTIACGWPTRVVQRRCVLPKRGGDVVDRIASILVAIDP